MQLSDRNAERLITAANVINPEAIKSYLENKNIPKLDGKDTCYNWVMTTVRKYIINNTELLQPATLGDIGNKEIPEWAMEAIKRKEPLYAFNSSSASFNGTRAWEQFNPQLDHIFDWLLAEYEAIYDPLEAQGRAKEGVTAAETWLTRTLSRISFPEAVRQSEAWTEKLNKVSTKKEGKVETVYSFPDGWKVVQLLDQQALDREGKLMNHCVSGYGDSLDHVGIYSLRDLQNNPKVTFEEQLKPGGGWHTPAPPKWNQVRANSNAPVPPELQAKVLEFLQSKQGTDLPHDVARSHVGLIHIGNEYITYEQRDERLKKLNEEQEKVFDRIKTQYPGWQLMGTSSVVSPDNKWMTVEQAQGPEPYGRNMPPELLGLNEELAELNEKIYPLNPLVKRAASKRGGQFGTGMWWLDPNGEMIPVSDHKDYAKRHILGKGNGFFKVYERMEEKGYFRLVMEVSYDTFKAPKLWVSSVTNKTPNSAQIAALEIFGIKKEVRVVLEPSGKVIYEPPRQIEGQAGYYGSNSPFDSIQLGDQDVRVVTLSTPKEQAQGFQHHKEIPTTYGYMFPGAGGQLFHTFNCPQVLMISLDNDHKVVGKEIRDTEQVGKSVAGGRGKHILELHPMYDPYVQVGKRIGQKGTNKGWPNVWLGAVDSDGKIVAKLDKGGPEDEYSTHNDLDESRLGYHVYYFRYVVGTNRILWAEKPEAKEVLDAVQNFIYKKTGVDPDHYQYRTVTDESNLAHGLKQLKEYPSEWRLKKGQKTLPVKGDVLIQEADGDQLVLDTGSLQEMQARYPQAVALGIDYAKAAGFKPEQLGRVWVIKDVRTGEENAVGRSYVEGLPIRRR
jgi:hypothetical protein